MFMYGIKMFPKNEKELESQKEITWIYYCQYIGMELGNEKFSLLMMKKGKRETIEGREPPK